MGATSSEILHLLKVELPLQNNHRWLLMISWFSNFPGEGPQNYHLSEKGFQRSGSNKITRKIDIDLLFIFVRISMK